MATNQDSTRYQAWRGDIRALTAQGPVLRFVTTHPEAQRTPLYEYHLDLDKLSEVPLLCDSGARGLAAIGNDLYITCADDSIERLSGSSQKTSLWRPSTGETIGAIVPLNNNRLALTAGTAVLILDRNDASEVQRIEIDEELRSIASSPDGLWFSVGTSLGTVAVFTAENRSRFEPGDRQKIHDGPVTALLFDKNELRFISIANDGKVLQSHARGRLEPEDRGGKSRHEEPVTAILQGSAPVFYTGSSDKTFKTWPAGLTRQRPYTIDKGLGPISALALTTFRNRPHLAIACSNTELRLWELDSEESPGRPKDRALTIEGAMARIEQELANKDRLRREAALRLLRIYNDAPSIERLATRALDDDDHELRVLAAQLLGDTQNPRATSALENLLGAPDEAVRLSALSGLRQLEGLTALRPLTLALGKARADIGLAAIKALQELARSDDEALTELINALERDPWEVRLAALDALEALDPSKPQEALLTALRSSRPDLRRVALIRSFERKVLELPDIQAALRRHGEDADAEVRQTAFFCSLLSQPTLAQALRERDRDLHRKLNEIEAAGKPDHERPAPESISIKDDQLPKSLNDEARRPLLQAMASRARDTCLRGATTLAILRDSRAFGTLLQLSRERDTASRVEVCKALRNLEDQRAIARLRLMIRDPEASVRDAAFSALGRLEASQPLDTAEAGLLADHEDVRRRALQILIEEIRSARPKGPQERSWQLLQRALNDSFPHVRSETFKASLNLDFAGGGEHTLRFALQSLHRDIRNEVFVEISARIDEAWGWPLLLDLFKDPDPAIRKDAFDFAGKRAKGRLIELLSAALQCPFVDLRTEATKSLRNCKESGAEDLLVKALDDDQEAVRQLALEALLATGISRLGPVLKSPYPDIRVRAANACAARGDQQALFPLLQLISEPKPDKHAAPNDLARWRERLELALNGLAELGSTEALPTIAPLLQSDDPGLRKSAALALAASSRPDHSTQLREALRHDDPAVRLEAALGLAACGDLLGASLIFDSANKTNPSLTLRAAIALGDSASNNLLAMLDQGDEANRLRAFNALMLLELGAPSQNTDPQHRDRRCLAGLAAEFPELRLRAAEALEASASLEDFAAFLTKLINDRGDDKAWAISTQTIASLADLLARAPSWLRYRAAALLDELNHRKQDAFDDAWRRFSLRFEREIAELASKRPKRPSRSNEQRLEAASLVFGTYVGLARLDHPKAATIRPTALRRLFELSKRHSSVSQAVRPVLIQALADENQSVRRQAFELFSELANDLQDLCAEALNSAQRDVGALGFQKLLAEGDESESRGLLESVLLRHEDGLEHEAAKALAESIGELAVHELSFAARSNKLRSEAVLALAKKANQTDNQNADPKAASSLRKALQSRFKDTRLLAASELAARKDPAAFDELARLLRSNLKNEQLSAIEGLVNLADPRAPALFLDRIDSDPAGSAQRRKLFDAIGQLRIKNVFDRLLDAIRKNRSRDLAFEAALRITGFDQPTPHLEITEADEKTFLRDQHPRDPKAFATLLETTARLADEARLNQLIPAATWTHGSELEGPLTLLAAFPKETVRHAALEALSWRSRKRKGSTKAIEKALEHEDPISRFIAAEALALLSRKDGLTILLSSVELLPAFDLRKRAVRALGFLGDHQALDLLLRLINEDGNPLQEDAAEALGHMRNSDKAEEVFRSLLRLSAPPYSFGVILASLSGLRHFNSHRAWDTLYGRFKDQDWRIRRHIANLLRHDPNPTKARELLSEAIEEDFDNDVVATSIESLRILDNQRTPDSLEPDYLALTCRFSYLITNSLERLKARGEPGRILDILPKVKDDSIDTIVDVLLSLSPLPLEAAARALETSSKERILRVAAQILGRAGDDAKTYASAITQACLRTAELWQKAEATRRPDQPVSESLTETWRQLLLSCGRLELGAEALEAATDQDLPKSIREAAFSGLARKLNSDTGLDTLAAAITDADADIRSIAAAGLASRAPQRAGQLALRALDDRTCLDRLLNKVDTEDSRKALRQAAATVHHQGVALPHLISRRDISSLGEALENSKLPEAARLGALEGLACMASEQAEALLAAFASKTHQDQDDEDLRKAAWRALRRSKRARAASSSIHGGQAA